MSHMYMLIQQFLKIFGYKVFFLALGTDDMNQMRYSISRKERHASKYIPDIIFIGRIVMSKSQLIELLDIFREFE